MTAITPNKTATHLFEKHRPRHVRECILLPDHREAFESFIAKGHAPHMFLFGPPGVGKTSVAMALATDMGLEVMRKNAAMYANIDAVRTELATLFNPGLRLPNFWA